MGGKGWGWGVVGGRGWRRGSYNFYLFFTAIVYLSVFSVCVGVSKSEIYKYNCLILATIIQTMGPRIHSLLSLLALAQV